MKIKDVCLGITDGSHNPPQGVENSNYLMLSSKNIFDDEITFDSPRYLTQIDFEQENKRSKVKSGDVLLTIVGTVGRVAVVDEKMPQFTLQRSVAVLHPNKDICSSRYLMYALRGKRMYIESRAKGVAQKGIYLKEVADIELQVPEISEQNAIVEVLDKSALIMKFYQQQLQKLDELVKARFIELFGDPLGNDKGWQKALIAEVCNAIFGGGTPSKSHPEYFAGSIPWVSPKDMKSSVINDSIDHITEEAIAHSTTNLVPANSVLMVIRSGILKHTLPVAVNSLPVTINQDMKAFVPNETVKTAFLLYFFKAIENDVLAGVRGVTADNIDFKAFQKRTIIVPPLALQEQFVAFVTQADKSKVAVQKALDEAQLLFDSLMQKYFG